MNSCLRCGKKTDRRYYCSLDCLEAHFGQEETDQGDKTRTQLVDDAYDHYKDLLMLGRE